MIVGIKMGIRYKYILNQMNVCGTLEHIYQIDLSYLKIYSEIIFYLYSHEGKFRQTLSLLLSCILFIELMEFIL